MKSQPDLFASLPPPKPEPAPTNAHYDEAGLFIHYCHCGTWGAFGIGVSLRKGQLGMWYCEKHRELGDSKMSELEITPILDIRPIYETKESQEVEKEMALTLGTLWGCDVTKMPRAYRLDFAALREKQIVAWLELKRRYRAMDAFPTTFLSLQKVFAAHEFHNLTGLPCLFVVKFDDCMVYADMLPKRRIEFRGRTDRNDWQDQEPVVLIPNEQFSEIKG